MSHSLHNRLSKRETRQSEANPGKRSKPSNIVANVASFIPLVKPKVQPACGKSHLLLPLFHLEHTVHTRN